MELEELNGRYRHLRTELDAAYAAPCGTVSGSTRSQTR